MQETEKAKSKPLKGGKMSIYKSCCSDIPAFKRKKTSFKDSSNIKRSAIEKVHNLNEQVISTNVNRPNEKLTESSGSQPIQRDGLLINKETTVQHSSVLNLEAVQGSDNVTVQTSPEVQTEEMKEYDCPYLDHLVAIDFDTGKPYADPIARKKEIIEELKRAESYVVESRALEECSSGVGSGLINPCAPKIDYEATKPTNQPKPPEKKVNIKKIKVDCPVCKKNVVAVGFVLHLSRCMGVNTRRSARNSKK